MAGRHAIPIDLDDLEKLAGLQCTYDEAAAWLGMSPRTFDKRMQVPKFREVWNRGREKGLTSLRRSQFKLAEKSAAMAIFLGKNYLGQCDTHEITGKDGTPLIGDNFVRIIVEGTTPAHGNGNGNGYHPTNGLRVPAPDPDA